MSQLNKFFKLNYRKRNRKNNNDFMIPEEVYRRQHIAKPNSNQFPNYQIQFSKEDLDENPIKKSTQSIKNSKVKIPPLLLIWKWIIFLSIFIIYEIKIYLLIEKTYHYILPHFYSINFLIKISAFSHSAQKIYVFDYI